MHLEVSRITLTLSTMEMAAPHSAYAGCGLKGEQFFWGEQLFALLCSALLCLRKATRWSTGSAGPASRRWTSTSRPAAYNQQRTGNRFAEMLKIRTLSLEFSNSKLRILRLQQILQHKDAFFFSHHVSHVVVSSMPGFMRIL